jgi:hypothetical protein
MKLKNCNEKGTYEVIDKQTEKVIEKFRLSWSAHLFIQKMAKSERDNYRVRKIKS